jgi:hypothetical protein
MNLRELKAEREAPGAAYAKALASFGDAAAIENSDEDQPAKKPSFYDRADRHASIHGPSTCVQIRGDGLILALTAYRYWNI